MTFLEALHSGRTLLMDGAMGTELIRRGYTGPSWRANVDAPELVAAIHADYAAAGAEVALANTFLLAMADEPAQIASKAIALANGRWVLASLAPLDHRPNFPDLTAVVRFAKMFDSADGLLLETCSDASAFAAADAIHEAMPNRPILVSFWFSAESANSIEDLARRAQSSSIAALGVNCGRDQSPSDVGRTIARMRSCTTKPLFARPNASTLSMNDWARETAKIDGLAMVGGCCGTTPDSIRELQLVRKRFAVGSEL